MRIIRVTGCHKCPYVDYDEYNVTGEKAWCEKGHGEAVISYFTNKPLPDNCPLEEVELSNFKDGESDIEAYILKKEDKR